jgi:hypothetical protein
MVKKDERLREAADKTARTTERRTRAARVPPYENKKGALRKVP